MAIYTMSDLRNLISNAFTGSGVNPWSGQKIEDRMIDIHDSHKAYVESLLSGLSGNASSLLYAPVALKYGLNIKSFGNSITEGSASNPFSNSYIALLNSVLGGTLTNQGLSGYSSQNALRDINQGLRDSAMLSTRNYLATWMLGINDLIFSTSAGAKFSNTDAALEFLCIAFHKTIIGAFDGAVSVTGSWSPHNLLTVGGRTNGRLSSTAGDSISVNLGGGSGRLFVVLGANPETDTENWASSVRIEYTGGINFIVNPNKSRNNFGHYTVVIDTHAYTLGGTLTITNVSGGKLVVDYFGDCKLPQNCYPALVYDTTHCSNWWFDNGGAFAPAANNAWIDESNLDARVKIVDKFKSWGYPVAIVDSNRYFNPETMTPDPNGVTAQPDGIHPNNTGHDAIHESQMESIILLPTVY